MPITTHTNAVEVVRLPDDKGAAAYQITSGYVNYEHKGNGPTERWSWSVGDFPCAGTLEEWEKAGISIIVKGAA